MIEVATNLFVGSEQSLKAIKPPIEDWAIVHACKHPFHKAFVGYKGNAAPKNHLEYLVARRENRLALNLIDPPEPKYIPKEIMDTAINFIHEQMGAGKKVLVHCNQGQSRSSGIALLYLAQQGIISQENFLKAEQEFATLYPPCKMAGGIRGFLQIHWEQYFGNQ